jgi:hypothetical protein
MTFKSLMGVIKSRCDILSGISKGHIPITPNYLFLGPLHGHCVIHNLGSFILCHPNGQYLIDISFIGSFENLV